MHAPKWGVWKTVLTGRVRFTYTKTLLGRKLVTCIEVRDIFQRYPGETRDSEPYWVQADKHRIDELIALDVMIPEDPENEKIRHAV